MRPVSLSLTGLQSYRERVDIDFEQLYEAGVFGIFGPTGSGKSTILDAMTLALYGKVERALNGTQGIMNLAEDKMSVSFTFELVHPDGSERYRVERQFKRTGDVSVSAAVTRLVQLQPEERVMADKARDVDAEVESLLGLTMQDFTRAVVLPQGKFAEFLQLKGSDRRQMLQRLFRLEIYGDELAVKLSGRLKAVDVEKKQAEAELAGIGDASELVLEQAEKAVEAAAFEAATVKDKVRKLEAEAKQLELLLGWKQELDRLDEHLDGHRKQLPDIMALEGRLEQASKAERIRPYHEQYQRMADTARQGERRLVEASTARGIALEQFRSLELAFEEARKRRDAEEPVWHRRREQLEGAVKLERETSTRVEEIEQARQAVESVRATAETGRKELATKRELLDKALKRQAEIKGALQAEEMPESERKQLIQAWDEWKDIRLQEKTAEELETEYVQETKQLASLESAVGEAEQALRDVQGLGDDIVRAVDAWRGAETSLGRMKEQLAEARDRMTEQVRSEEEIRLALRLAECLAEGEACPVCGSFEHPHPAALAEEHASTSLLEDTAERIMLALADVDALSLECRRHLLAWQQRAAGYVEFGMSSYEPLPEAAAAAEAVENHAEFDANLLIERWHRYKEELRHWFDRSDNEGEQAQLRLQSIKERSGQLERRRMEVAARKESFVRVRSRRDEHLQRLNLNCNEWRNRYPNLDSDGLQSAVERLQAADERIADLRRRLAASEDFIADARTQTEALQFASHDAEKREMELRLTLDRLEKLQEEQTGQLRAIVGVGTVEAALQEAEAEIRKLSEDSEHKRTAMEAARAAWQTAEAGWNGAKETVEAYRKQHAEAELEWQRRLAASTFETERGWQEALLAESDRNAGAKRLETYREKEKEWTAARAALAEKLGDHAPTTEDWERVSEQLSEGKQAEEAAISAEARAMRDLEQLRDKHVRWTELQSALADKELLLGRLQKLQSVLRGNALVEFLAEEQLMQVSRAASVRLGQLTRNRYALEVDSGGGFVIRDQMNGGVRRPVSTLSGGETFLTSLSLALALSAQIQLRGKYPLQFFFLDEGFGTLDPDLLEAVIGALERLHLDRLTVGVISHVPELRARLPRKLIVEPADQTGRGSRVRMETL